MRVAYAQRLTYGGVAAWTTNGVPVATGTPDADAAVIAADGLGGALIAWRDYRNSLANADLYAQRLNGNGSAMWTSNGVLVGGTPVNQFDYAIVADGANGAILAWCESRVSGYDVLCQRVERFGALGEPGPVITQVKDVPADQGGHVRLTWNGSYLDADPEYAISEYWVWREVPVSLALSARAAGTTAASGEFVTPHGRYLITGAGATSYAWEYLTALEASGFSTYSYVAPTAYDSLPGENRWTRFMVQARSSANGYYWNSAPDSGYSVDNLAPPAPAPFTGQYASGTATLHWAVNPAADFAEYRLYRGSTADFVPEPGNLVVARPDTGYVDAAGAPYYYKLCAVDVHGNVSSFTLLLPSGTAEVPNGASLAFALEGVQPNPSHGERLSVAFALPTAAPARLELVDVSGRRVVEREVGTLGAGRHTLDLGQGTSLAPGLYLVCLRQGANMRVTRVAVLK